MPLNPQTQSVENASMFKAEQLYPSPKELTRFVIAGHIAALYNPACCLQHWPTPDATQESE